jgi:hypothetical protein
MEMSFEFLEQTAGLVEQMGCSINEVSHVVGKMSEAMGCCSHAEGASSYAVPKDLIGIGGFTKDGNWKEVKLPKKQTIIDKIVKMSIYRE